MLSVGTVFELVSTDNWIMPLPHTAMTKLLILVADYFPVAVGWHIRPEGFLYSSILLLAVIIVAVAIVVAVVLVAVDAIIGVVVVVSGVPSRRHSINIKQHVSQELVHFLGVTISNPESSQSNLVVISHLISLKFSNLSTSLLEFSF
ncbi:hypothetical protein Tco_0151768 [Tanacetum coccineum]